jgi:DNA repair exonuclease SbcCD ATPase subunit
VAIQFEKTNQYQRVFKKDKKGSSLNQLKKINIVNSYVPGRINSFDVDGGCIVQGTNGAGKTSLLRLSLLFFGVQPSEIARIAGKGNRFSEYYLRTQSSYIVFEYQKDEKNLLVIAYSKDRNELTYQFCDGKFDESLFLGASGRFISHNELKAHITQNTDRKVSAQYTWSQYKEIIQSAIRMPGRTQQDRSMNEAKLKYSLSEPNKSITGAEKVASSIIESKASLQSVRSLIAHGILGLDDLIDNPSHAQKFDPVKLTKQRNLLKQAKEFRKKSPMLQEMVYSNQIISNLEQEISQVKSVCLYSLEHHQSSFVELTSKVGELKSTLEKLKVEIDKTTAELNESIGQVDAKIFGLKAQIDSLESKYKAYQLKDIEAQKLLAQEVEILLDKVKSEEDLKGSLESEYQDIVRRYEQKLNKAKQQVQAQIDKAREAKDRFNESALLNKDAEGKNERSAIKALTSRYSSEDQSLRASRDELIAKRSRLEGEAKNPTNPEVQRLLAKLKTVKSLLEQKQTELNDSIKKGAKFSLEHSRLEKTRNQKLTDLNGLGSKVTELEGKVQAHEQALKNLEKTLYHQMRELSPERSQLALRVLRKDVLQKTVEGLSFNDKAQGVLGFDFNFNDMPAQEILDQRELEATISNLGIDLEKAKVYRISLEADLEGITAQIASLDKVLLTAQLTEKRLDNDVINHAKTVKGVDSQIEIESCKLKHDLEEGALAVSANLAVVESELSAIKRKFEDEKQEIETAYLVRVDEIESEINASETRFNDLVEQVTSELALEAQRFDELKQKDLSDKGAQVEELQRIDERIKSLSEHLDVAKIARNFVQEYRLWFESDYLQLAPLKNQKAGLSLELECSRNRLKDAKDVYQKHSQVLNSELTVKDADLKTSESEMNTFESMLEIHLNQVVEDAEYTIEQVEPAAEIASELLVKKSQLKEASAKGGKHYQALLNSLRQTKEFYEVIQGALAAQGIEDVGVSPDWRAHIKALRYIMGDFSATQIARIHEEFKLISLSLIDIDAKLDDQARRIQEKGREISRKMNEAGTSFSKIESIQAKVTSNIDKIRFRHSLRATAKEANEVKMMPIHEEPSEHYFELVSNAIYDISKFGRSLYLEELIEVEISIKNKGVSEVRTARNDKELKSIDSEGLSFLILLSLYMAIKNTFQKGHDIKLLWPLDELGKLHPDNVEALMGILRRENVDFLCAEPSTNPKVLRLFKHLYSIDVEGRVKKTEASEKPNPAQAFVNSMTDLQGVKA